MTLARDSARDFNSLLTRYVLERFLCRWVAAGRELRTAGSTMHTIRGGRC